MESSPTKSTLHPLLLIAAASVTALSLAGVGYFAGWLPGPRNKTAEPAVSSPVAQAEQATTNAIPAPPPAASSSKEAPPAEHISKPKKHHTQTPTASAAASPAPTFSHSPAAVTCVDCGVVASINEVMVEPAGSGVGAVAGGVVGGVLGNQIGKGNGRTVATVLGVAGGAYAGNAIEKSVKKTKRYDVVVRFDDGTTRTFSSTTVPEWRNGDRVRLQNGVLTPRN
jgi:outer membrane lipoprotein SlyB